MDSESLSPKLSAVDDASIMNSVLSSIEACEKTASKVTASILNAN
jgi:hypothetical protein